MASLKTLVRDIVRHDLEQTPLEIDYANYHELLYHTQQIWNRVYNSVGLEKTQLNLVYARHLTELLDRFPEQSSNDIEVKALTALGNYATSMAESAPNLTSHERIEYSLSALDCFRSRNSLMPLNSTSLTLVRVALQIYLNALTELRAEQGSFGFNDIAEEADNALEPYHTLILLTANNRQNLRNNLLFDFFRARARILLAQGQREEYRRLFAEARNHIDPMLLNPERRNTWHSYRIEAEMERGGDEAASLAPSANVVAASVSAITASAEPRRVVTGPLPELPAQQLAPLPNEEAEMEAEAEPQSHPQFAAQANQADRQAEGGNEDEDEGDDEEETLAHLGPMRTPQAWLEHKMTPNDPQRSTNVPHQLFPYIQGGIDLYKSGNYEAALEQFKQAEMLNPNPAFRHVILYNQAAALLALGSKEQSQLAEQLLEQAVTMGSRLPGLRWNLAVAYWRNHGVDRRLIATLSEVVDAGRKAPLCAAAAAHILGDPLGALGALIRAKALPGSLPDIDAELAKLVEDFPSVAPQVSAEQARFAATRYQQPQSRFPRQEPAYQRPFAQPNSGYQPRPYAPPPNNGYPPRPYQQPEQPYQRPYQQPEQPYQRPNYQQPEPPPYQQRPNYPPTQPNYPQPQQPPYQPPRPNQEPPYQRPGYQPNYQPRTYNPNQGGGGSYSPNAYGQGYPQRTPYPNNDYPQRGNQPYLPNREQPPTNGGYPARPYPQPTTPPQQPTTQPQAAAGSSLARVASVMALYEGLLEQISALVNPELPADERQRHQLELARGLSRIERHSRETLTSDEQATLATWLNKWKAFSDNLAQQVRRNELLEVRGVQTYISNAPSPSGLILAVTNRGERAAQQVELRLPPRPDTYELPYFADAERGLSVGLDELAPGQSRYLRLMLAPRRYGSLELMLELSYYEEDDSTEGATLRRSHIMLTPSPATAKFEPLPTVYLAGEAIPPDRADIFKGRNEEITKIKASLGFGDTVMRSQSAIPYLTGAGKVGKSSLLNNLINPNIHADLHESLLPVHISMDEYQSDEYRLSTFLAAVAGKINDALRAANRPTVPIDQQGLREQPLITFFDGFLSVVNDALKPRRLLLMFDEFRYLADKVKRGEWDAAFLGKLRTLYQQGQVCLIFAGRGAFNEITRGLEEPSLLDSVRDHPLSFLSAQAVAELVREPSGRRGINFVPEAVTLISQLTAGHPFFVQYICHDVISEVLNRERRTIATPEDVLTLKQLYLQSDNLFSHLWNNEMRELHQDVIFTLLNLQQGDNFVTRQAIIEALPNADNRELAGSIEQLTRREVLEDGAMRGQNGVRVRIPLLHEWFRSKHERGLSLSAFSRQDHLSDIKALTQQVMRLRRNINRAAPELVFKEGVFDENNINILIDTYAEDWTGFHRFVDTLYKSIGHEAIVARDFLREVPRFFDVVRDLQYIRNGIVAHRPDNADYPDSADAAYNIIDKYLGHQPGSATDFLELQEDLLRATIAGLNELHQVVARQ